MAKFLLDLHTHSTFSHDGRSGLEELCAAACEKGLLFYGVTEHFDYEAICEDKAQEEKLKGQRAREGEYFHAARHLQDDYAGAMNVLVGAEFGFSEDENICKEYAETYEKYRPDYLINSVHCLGGVDIYYNPVAMANGYTEFLKMVRKSLDAPYPYDIVGHLEYAIRYTHNHAPITMEEYGDILDDIFLTIIKKDKILEVNTATKDLPQICLPNQQLLQRYFDLGGRNISFGSDAHETARLTDKFEEVVRLLKKIGFTHFTVPCKGEYIKVEM